MPSPDPVAALDLPRRPIAIAFLDAPPPGVARWDGGEVPAGCSFWAQAQAGRSFVTEAKDHHNCAVGCHTHSIALPPSRQHELQEAVCMMVESGYLREAEVPGIPTLPSPPRFIAYGPADAPGFAPDVVLVAALPAQAMLLYEALQRARVAQPLVPSLGRPACAVLPLAHGIAAPAASLGCAGNRVFTGLPPEEMYIAIPAAEWQRVSAALGEVLAANASMRAHYEGRKTAFEGA